METQTTKMFASQIKKIRDILRTVGVTDQDSIIHCIAFISLRRLTANMCSVLEIPEEFAFENFDSELDDEELRNKFWLPDAKSNCFVTYLRTKMGFKSFKFSEVITNLHFRNIFSCLQDIETEQLKKSCDIVGDIYELHLKTGSKSSRDLGQFFTNRLVIKFMVELTDPKLNDNGQIETIVDPTMGTGGFLTIAVDHINKQGKVNWKKNCKRIFGYDLDNRVRDYANINLMLETGQKFPNLFTRDTLSNDICIEEKPISCDVILANEPMGIKGLKFAGFCDRIKDLKMSGTKAEPAFLQLFMQALNKGGRCAVVVPDGVLFSTSKQHSDTRKYLIENFEVREIVKMNDKNFFMNTGVSASIIYFAKVDDSLEMVKFSEISLNKDATELIYKEMKDVEYDKIREKNYILSPSIYLEEEKTDICGIEYKTLGEVCEIDKNLEKHPTNFGNPKGKYKFHTGADSTNLYVDKPDFVELYIIQNRTNGSGKCSLFLDKNFSLAKQTIAYKANSELETRYIYYYLKTNIYLLEKGFVGTNHKNISKEYISNIKIPIPRLYVQKQIVEKLDLLSETNLNCKKLVEQLKQKFKIYMELETGKYTKKIKLSEICDYKLGKFISRDCQQEGKYPFYNSKAIGFSGYSDKFCFDYPEYLIITKDGGAGNGKYGEQIGMGTVYKVQGKAGATSHQLALIPKNINFGYFYYSMKSLKNKIMDLAQYTTGLGTIKTSVLMDIEIPLVDKNKQQEIVQKCDSIFSLISSLETQITENKVMMKEILESLVFQGGEKCDTKIVIEDEVHE